MRCFSFFNDTATTEIYTLPLHGALPISVPDGDGAAGGHGALRRGVPLGHGAVPLDHPAGGAAEPGRGIPRRVRDRKSTRLNSSHANTSYAVFCLKKTNV